MDTFLQRIQDKYDIDAKDLFSSVRVPEGSTLAKEAGKLLTQIKTAVKAEIQNDPAGRGYAGKTNAQKFALLTAEYDPLLPPRLHTVLVGIPYAPNAVTAAELLALVQ